MNTSNAAIANALAPQQSMIVTGKGISLFDLGLEGMGQGYAGQMTPLQMAMIAAIPGQHRRKSDEATYRSWTCRHSTCQVLSPQQAAQIRDIMSSVQKSRRNRDGDLCEACWYGIRTAVRQVRPKNRPRCTTKKLESSGP
jgi:hypothetical protein